MREICQAAPLIDDIRPVKFDGQSGSWDWLIVADSQEGLCIVNMQRQTAQDVRVYGAVRRFLSVAADTCCAFVGQDQQKVIVMYCEQLGCSDFVEQSRIGEIPVREPVTALAVSSTFLVHCVLLLRWVAYCW